jgi:hypothetical protein
LKQGSSLAVLEFFLWRVKKQKAFFVKSDRRPPNSASQSR